MTTVYRTKFFRVCVLVAAGCLLTAGGALASEKAAGWQPSVEGRIRIIDNDGERHHGDPA